MYNQVYRQQLRHAIYYRTLSHHNSENLALLQLEFPQLQAALEWMGNHLNGETSQILLAMIASLERFLREQSRFEALLTFTSYGLSACQLVQEPTGTLWLLRFRAHYSLGDWGAAFSDIQEALAASVDKDHKVYALALLTLGSLQLNVGDYKEALDTLAQAEEAFRDLGDHKGIAEARAEMAAFYLNRNDFNRAFQLYSEVHQLRVDAGADETAIDHSLLMLGVVNRRLGHVDFAKGYFLQLLARADERGNMAVEATASHHLAWVLIDQTKYAQAIRLGTRARELYEFLGDARGSADAEEQLGVIAVKYHNLSTALEHFTRSLEIRNYLGNQHGIASVLRRLGLAYMRNDQYWRGARHILASLLLYAKLGMLSGNRLRSVGGDIWTTLDLSRSESA